MCGAMCGVLPYGLRRPVRCWCVADALIIYENSSASGRVNDGFARYQLGCVVQQSIFVVRSWGAVGCLFAACPGVLWLEHTYLLNYVLYCS